MEIAKQDQERRCDNNEKIRRGIPKTSERQEGRTLLQNLVTLRTSESPVFLGEVSLYATSLQRGNRRNRAHERHVDMQMHQEQAAIRGKGREGTGLVVGRKTARGSSSAITDGSRIGLHLVDEYARGSPAWAAWRNRVATGASFLPTGTVLRSNDKRQ